MFERGEVRPRWRTAERLADALNLAGIERDEFLRQVDAAGKPSRVQAAIAGPTLWRHLPTILLNDVEHDPVALFGPDDEELTVDLARGIGSLLGWLVFAKAWPVRAERKRVQLAATRIFHRCLELAREYPNLGWSNETAAYNVASALPVLWRNELFGRRPTTVRSAALIHRWSYSRRGPRGSPCLDVLLKDQVLDHDYSFNQAGPEMVANVHDSMVAYRLWIDLELTRSLGHPPPESVQQFRLALQLGPSNADVDLLLRAAAAPEEIEQDTPENLKYFWQIRESAMRVDLALRLFKLPDLAARALQHSQAEIEKALWALVPIVGGLSVRFRSSCPPCPPTNPRSP